MHGIELLYKRLSTLIVLNAEDRNVIASLFKENTYKKGDFFLREGEVCIN